MTRPSKESCFENFSAISSPVAVGDRLPTMAELTVRLATLTAQAPDVRSTMEAVATGLLLGTRTTWGGRYLAW